jgi:hypothetical protein
MILGEQLNPDMDGPDEGADVTEIDPGLPNPEMEVPVGVETMTLTI